jgi:transposase-like protein
MPNTTTLEERLYIIERSQEAGLTDSEIANELDRSIETVRKWRRRGARLRRDALASKMGRPPEGALCSFSEELKECLLEWRRDNPGWGGPKPFAPNSKPTGASPPRCRAGLPSGVSSRSRVLRAAMSRRVFPCPSPRRALPKHLTSSGRWMLAATRRWWPGWAPWRSST